MYAAPLRPALAVAPPLRTDAPSRAAGFTRDQK
jgi:hypothetical protein